MSATAAAAAANAAWLERVGAQLGERDRRECLPFEAIFQHFRAVQQSEMALRHRLERGVGGGGAAAALAASSGPPGSTSGCGSSAALESRVRELQTEVHEATRLRAETSEALLRAKSAQEALEKQLMRRERELQEARVEQERRQDETVREQAKVAGLTKTIEALGKELGAAREQLRLTEDKLRKTEQENNSLIARLLALKNEQVAEINAANEANEALRAELERREALLAANGGGSGAAAGASALRPASSERDVTSILDRVAWETNFNVAPPAAVQRQVSAHRGGLTSIRFNAGGALFATGGTDNNVCLWDARTGTPRATLRGSTQTVMCVAFSPDDSLVLASSNDRVAYLWALETGRVQHKLVGHSNKIFACAFAFDSKQVVTGSHDRTMCVWDAVTGARLRSKSAVSSVNHMAIASNGDVIGTAHLDCAARFWSLRTGELIHELKELHTQQVTGVDFSRDGVLAVTNSRDNTLRIVDARMWRVVHALAEEKGNFRNKIAWAPAVFSPDAQFVCAGSSDGSLFVWNAASGRLHSQVPNTLLRASSARRGSSQAEDPDAIEPVAVTSVAWSRNGRVVLSGDNLGAVYFWEPAARAPAAAAAAAAGK